MTDKKQWDVYLVNPDDHHNSWGIAISTDPRHRERHKYDYIGTVEEPVGGCHALTNVLIAFDRTGFHQGGYHGYEDRCVGWHYIEFFGMDNGEERGLQLLTFLETFVNGTPAIRERSMAR